MYLDITVATLKFAVTKIALWARLHYGQYCIMGKNALWARMHYGQECIMGKIALWARMHYGQDCIMGKIALWAILHYGQDCIMGKMHYRENIILECLHNSHHQILKIFIIAS